MCLSLPMRVREVDGLVAVGDVAGTPRRASLAILAAEGIEVGTGDWLLVAAGVAHRRLDAAEARSLVELLEEGAAR